MQKRKEKVSVLTKGYGLVYSYYRLTLLYINSIIKAERFLMFGHVSSLRNLI